MPNGMTWRFDVGSIELDLRWLISDPDRHGNPRLYVRRKPFPKIRIKERPDTPEFMIAYQAAVEKR